MRTSYHQVLLDASPTGWYRFVLSEAFWNFANKNHKYQKYLLTSKVTHRTLHRFVCQLSSTTAAPTGDKIPNSRLRFCTHVYFDKLKQLRYEYFRFTWFATTAFLFHYSRYCWQFSVTDWFCANLSDEFFMLFQNYPYTFGSNIILYLCTTGLGFRPTLAHRCRTSF